VDYGAPVNSDFESKFRSVDIIAFDSWVNPLQAIWADPAEVTCWRIQMSQSQPSHLNQRVAQRQPRVAGAVIKITGQQC